MGLVEDAMASYFDEIEQTKAMLDRRYDDIKSGRVTPIDGEEALRPAPGKKPCPAQKPGMSGYILLPG